MCFFQKIWQRKNPKKEEQSVSIVEIFFAMQENQQMDSLLFARIVKSAFSVVDKIGAKVRHPKYKIGDVVFLKDNVIDLNWKLQDVIGKPFIIVETPANTGSFKTYTLRLLEEGKNQDCWSSFNFHEDFFCLEVKNA